MRDCECVGVLIYLPSVFAWVSSFVVLPASSLLPSNTHTHTLNPPNHTHIHALTGPKNAEHLQAQDIHTTHQLMGHYLKLKVTVHVFT